MPLDIEHVEGFCKDVEGQVRDGVCSMPLFCMTLTPEGIPAIDKAKLLSERYREYKKRLLAKGIPSGALIQASIGHGWKLNQPSKFQKYTGFIDGSTPEICCPLDKGFQEYIRAAAKTIASEHPDHIMLDDDFRLMYRPQRGCACPLHMARFNRLAQTSFTREELLGAIVSGGEVGAKYKEIFVKTQIDSLIECAKEIRAGIDEIDAKIPGSFCAVGAGVEGAYEIAKIMAGVGNPVTVRINNGNYCATDHREIAHIMTRLATQASCLTGKPDFLLAETDTCPQNRYSTSASKLHTHYTLSILSGATGAKHWLTRLSFYEPKAGIAYRKKLASHRRFYEEVARLASSSVKLGCKIPVATRQYFPIEVGNPNYYDGDIPWSYRILERLGLPMHADNSAEGVAFLGGERDTKFTDGEILKMLSGKVVLDATSAMRLCERGFGEYLGVCVTTRAADAKNVSGELLPDGRIMKAMPKICEMTALDESVRVWANGYFLKDGVEKEILFPTVASFKNSLGGEVVTFAGSTSFVFNLVEAFGWLSETRKELIADILSYLGALTVYYPDDVEMLLQAARLSNGSIMVAAFNTGLDEIENFPLVSKLSVREISRLMPNGEYENLDFSRTDDRYELDCTVRPYTPEIFILKV